MLFITNTFSVGMIKNYIENHIAYVVFTELTPDIAKKIVEREKVNGIFNAIGHEGTVSIANYLLGTNFNKANRIEIELKWGDKGIAVLPKFRLQEGQVLSEQEIMDLYNNGQIMIVYFAIVMVDFGDKERVLFK